jgi:dipeptidyl aminopeptidase/acylaminoacyl peptidase
MRLPLPRFLTCGFAALAVLALASPNAFPDAPAPARKKKKAAVSAADYAQWETLRADSQSLSDDGRWLAYIVSRVDKKQSLHLLDLNGKTKSKPVVTYPQGGDPVFSKDSQWLAVSIGKTPEEIKKLEKAPPGAPKPPAGRVIKLRRLKDGVTTEIKSVLSISFSGDSRFAAIEIEGTPAPDKKGGRALIVRDLKNGTDTTFGNIATHAWSDRGALLAMVVDSPDISNTLQVFDPRRGLLRTLDSSPQDYTSLRWRKDAMDLVAAREMEHGKDEDVSHVLLAWRGLGDLGKRGEKTAMIFNHATKKPFPDGMYVASGTPSWTKDGRGVLVDLREWKNRPKALAKSDAKTDQEKKAKTQPGKKPETKPETKPEAKPETKPEAEPGKDPKAAPAKEEAGNAAKPKPAEAKTLRESLEADSNVEVWHARDAEIMPLQKRRAAMEENKRRQAIWWPEKNKLVQLASDLTEEIRLPRSGNQAIGFDRTPHERTAMFGPRLNDIYRIDISSGKRKQLLTGVEHLLDPSPDGRQLLFVREGHIWSCRVDNGEERNLTAELKTAFTNQEDDSLAKEKRPYGQGRWLADSSAVLLDDRFDVWLVKPDGSAARRLTDGSGEMIRHRVSDAGLTPSKPMTLDEMMIRHRVSDAGLTRKDEGLLDPKRPLYLSLFGERSKKSGYARLQPGWENPANPPEVLIWEDTLIGDLRMAEKNPAMLVYRKESYRDSPDLFLTGPGFKDSVALTKTNPFQRKFRWGRAELVNYVNESGVELQGALIYPANYRKGRQYPMVTYIYERLSQNLHRYAVPSETHPYNPAVFSAEGYFVFMPDIVYRPQEPGPSAVECIVPGVKAVLATGMVDPAKVALIGHSWGAYQTAFTVTRSNVFAAGVAGAPLTNMMSMSMQIYWNSGDTNARIFSTSQGRMDKPFWRDVDNYIRNSPINGMDQLKTPLLVAFGDKDGAVDFSQGVEMYNAARRAEKDNFVMLVYPGENHGLARQENMVDYHYRIREWLAHYLKGEKAPKWITDGQTFLERKAELETRKKAREGGGKPAPKEP